MANTEHISEELSIKLENLTERDREVLSLLVKGLNNREIADQLELHHQTIRNRVSQMYKKLGLPPKRTRLVLWVVKNGYNHPGVIAPWLKGKGGDN